jgi:competence protein ComEA
MRNRWMTFAAALALLAGSALAGAATTQDAKPTPAAVGTAAPDKAPSVKPPAAKQKQVNLNAATAKELKALPGGSDEEAARIIAGRPYNSKAFLVTNKVISEARYVEIKSLVVAGEPAKAAAPKK